MSQTMRKFGLQFGAAKINIMEKMGKRDTTETIEMQHESKKVEETRHHLKEIYKKINKMNKSSSINIEDNQSLATAFREYSNVLANNGESPTLAGLINRMSVFQDFLDEIRSRLVINLI
jgi:ubiquitin